MRKKSSFKIKILVMSGLILAVSLTAVTFINSSIAKASITNRLLNFEIPAITNNIIALVQKDITSVSIGLSVIAEDPNIQQWIIDGEPEDLIPYINKRLTLTANRFNTMGCNLVVWGSKNYYEYVNNSYNIRKVLPEDTWLAEFNNSGVEVGVNAYTNYPPFGDVAFMNVRIDNNGDFLGVMSIAINLKDFVQSVNNTTIGDLGQNIMVDSSGVIRIHPNREYISNKNIKDEQGYIDQFNNINNRGSYSFSYLDNTGDTRYVNSVYLPQLDWYLITEASGNEIFKDINDAIVKTIIISIILLLVGYGILYIITTVVSKSLGKLTVAVDDISEGEGDLTKVISVNSRDEAGILGASLNLFISKLKDLVTNIKSVTTSSKELGEVLATNAEEISSTVVEIASTMNSLNSKTDILTSQIDNSHKSVLKIRGQIVNLNENIEREGQYISESSAAIEQMVASVKNVSKISESKKEAIEELTKISISGEEDMEATVDSIQSISSSINSLFDMIGVINNVSEQINILSMNAAIEAAHAGDAGKGFAVVADEIRKLAEATSNNTKVMSDSINKIISEVRGAEDLSTKTGVTIKTIMGEIKDVSGSLTEIVLSLTEISQGTNQITTSLSGLVDISNQVKYSSENIDDSSVQIEEAFSKVTDLSLQNRNGIEEISHGLDDISTALNELSELGGVNSDNMIKMEKEVNRFKT